MYDINIISAKNDSFEKLELAIASHVIYEAVRRIKSDITETPSHIYVKLKNKNMNISNVFNESFNQCMDVVKGYVVESNNMRDIDININENIDIFLTDDIDRINKHVYDLTEYYSNNIVLENTDNMSELDKLKYQAKLEQLEEKSHILEKSIINEYKININENLVIKELYNNSLDKYLINETIKAFIGNDVEYWSLGLNELLEDNPHDKPTFVYKDNSTHTI